MRPRSSPLGISGYVVLVLMSAQALPAATGGTGGGPSAASPAAGGITGTRGRREASPPNHHDDKVDSDHFPVMSGKASRAGRAPRRRESRCAESGCTTRPTFGREGGTASFCGKHRAPEHVDRINPRCVAPGCRKVASFGGSDTGWVRVVCGEHRGPLHLDLLHRRKPELFAVPAAADAPTPVWASRKKSLPHRTSKGDGGEDAGSDPSTVMNCGECTGRLLQPGAAPCPGWGDPYTLNPEP